MTLREKLDNKIKKVEIEKMYEEIEDIFLEFDTERVG